ncbi:PREDICTED: DNA ligase 4 isoform X1 [Ipomoea nil]|uniref:DNA ligase 4 isoform X1 n=1 Tax=Ipomoea nil TaxID=35883 RepID=UPI000900CE76|nr:PREDICTED: DNA ligase 4 isoform X1 [Ipomoea nil]
MAASSGGEDIKFSVVVSMFQWIHKSKSKPLKQSKFRKFLDTFCRKPHDYFAAMRLILPGLDRDRGSYGLKEHVLATCIIDALGISRDSDDAHRLLNWRKAGPRAGLNAGNFSLVAAEVLQRRQGVSSGGLTIKELNDLLDALASSVNRSEKTTVLSDLIRRTNAQEMKWIVMIILKDLKLGISEKSIFHEFHPDAEDLFNVTCDLKLVCEKLRDRNQRHKRQDIEVGKAVRPQLALRVSNAAAAWKKLHGKEVVVECKFDGDRIQIHKNKAEMHFFSRNFFDHQEYAHAMSDIIAQNILVEKCILDGEMLVWDTSANRFAEFGSNQEIAKAAREGLDSDRQLCYVAFDVLYVGDTSVIHQSLKERHELLRKVVKPIKGSLEILVPNGGLNAHRAPGELCWSVVGHGVDDVEKFFKATVENRDEGIVLKDLNSKWEPSDRSGKWLKLKPEYIRAGSDLDVLIIGGYYGSGRHGGKVAQFLVGISERPSPGTYPRRFISFCRVGTGLSDEELDAVVTRLKPYFRKYEYPKQTPPSFYQVTNSSKERPDVWVESPEKSIIVSITSDIRTIRSEVFAAPYSLRFPRIDRVRYDKPWHECLDVQTFVELVHSSNGTTQRGAYSGRVKDHEPKHIKSKSRERKNALVVPSHFIQTDVSHIKGETSIFSNMVFYFANVPSSHTLDSLHKMVVEHGGTFSMNLNNSVTHCIAAESRGIKFQAAKLRGDVVNCSWLFDCCSQKRLLPLHPKYFLFLSDATKKKLQEEVDEFSDSYYSNLNIDDFKQLLSSICRSEKSKTVEYYKKKYCPKDKWCCFHYCSIHFFLHMHSSKSLDQKVLLELAMRRLKLEVSMGGGKVSDDLFHATHLVIISLPEFCVDFDTLLRSFSVSEGRVMCSNKLHVVGSQWLEDCFEKNQKLPEGSYSLKPKNFEASAIKESESESMVEDHMGKHVIPSSTAKNVGTEKEVALEESTVNMLPKRDGKRKRRASGRSTTRGRGKASIIKQPRRTKFGSKPARIDENESSESDGSRGIRQNKFGGSDNEENFEFKRWNGENISNHDPEIPVEYVIEDSKPLTEGKEIVEECIDKNGVGGEWNASKTLSQNPLDPVQSILLNMIPSLEKTSSSTSTSMDMGLEQEKPPPPLDLTPNPIKKKKVSYKDAVAALLKD